MVCKMGQGWSHALLRRSLAGLFSVLLLVLGLGLAGCSLPQVSAEERLFLNLSLDFLDAYELPQATFDDTPVQGLSAIAYDRQRDRIYALSDDRGNHAPARFYTLKLNLDRATEPAKISALEIEAVTTLKGENGEPYAAGSIDPEGIALSPRQSLFISSEGAIGDGIAPFIDEFDLETGQWQKRLPIPRRYLPGEVEGQPQGVQDNLGFEALTLNPGGSTTTWLEPFRLFAAIESALNQDIPDTNTSDLPPPGQPIRSRFLHYLIGDELPTLLSEHLYLIDPPPEGAIANGLTEILTIDQGGHFLTLERSYSLSGFSARIFQAASGGATDTSGVSSLKGDITGIAPIRKQLLLDLSELDMPIDNLEGMTLGPQLPDGSQSLLVVSDDNFNPLQTTQFLLFRLRGEI